MFSNLFARFIDSGGGGSPFGLVCPALRLPTQLTS